MPFLKQVIGPTLRVASPEVVVHSHRFPGLINDKRAATAFASGDTEPLQKATDGGTMGRKMDEAERAALTQRSEKRGRSENANPGHKRRELVFLPVVVFSVSLGLCSSS